MTRTALILVALAAVAALLTACGGDDLSGEADVPEGWQTVREGDLSFAIPGEWRVSRRSGRDGARVIEAHGPGEKELAPAARVLMETAPGTPVDTMLRLRATADERLPDADVEEPRDVELEGAERAARWTTTYKAPAGAGRIDGLSAEREDGSSISVRALSLDRDEVDTEAIADSVRLGG
jgi:hypothetical protein